MPEYNFYDYTESAFSRWRRAFGIVRGAEKLAEASLLTAKKNFLEQNHEKILQIHEILLTLHSIPD
ncbi:MAG: hypothetical protein K2J18_04585, partial [Paramuribaculum sp.]|nr:hypothetical protein [Paramuribaculum sp.]